MTAVLPIPREVHSRFSPDPLLRCPTAQRYFLGQGVLIKSPMHDYCPSDYPSPISSSAPSSIPASPNLVPAAPEQLSSTPTTLSSLSLNITNENEDDEIILPSYDTDQLAQKDQNEAEDLLSETSADVSTDPVRLTLHTPCADDSSIEAEPSRHVDYLSYDWKEEDIWASWRYVIARRDVYSNGVRLENASWRTWAKSKNKLGTVSPETLNWLKDCDVTWLYGPLKTSNKHGTSNASPPPSRLETPNSILERKPILKKKTASETILQRSLTQHTLLKHAGAILQAQEAENPRGRPSFPRSTSDLDGLRNPKVGSLPGSIGSSTTHASSSGMISPSGRRHIHFNNEVVQCIAVEAKDGDEEDDDWPTAFDEDSSSDDGIVMMKQIPWSKASISNRSTPRSSFSSESKTIAPLPSTTLKYRGDTPEPPASTTMDRWSFEPPSSTLSPTPSVETLRPSQPQANFLLDDEDGDELDFNWQPKHSAYESDRTRPWFVDPKDEEEMEMDRQLHLTSSGMFMPYDEGESSNNTIFGRVIDTVNTARDIAHVIWNVGWRR